MDPISFTASLFALIGGARAGVKTLRQISSYRDAPGELKDISEELERFVLLLQQTINVVEDIDDATLKTRGKILTHEVDRAATKIDQINHILTSPNALAAKLHEQKQTKAIWMQHKKKIMAIQADLRHVFVTINYALEVLAT